MKKAAAILLITILLLNLTGRMLFVEFFIHQNDLILESQIDNGNYNKAQLIEIKIPLMIPYYSSSMKYERYYGETELEGRYYNYVMRKIQNDTVYLLCLANNVKTELYKAKAQYALNAADISGSSPLKKGTESMLKKIASSTDYFQQVNLFAVRNTSVLLPSKEHIDFTTSLISCFIEQPVKPPEMTNSNLSLNNDSYLLSGT